MVWRPGREHSQATLREEAVRARAGHRISSSGAGLPRREGPARSLYRDSDVATLEDKLARAIQDGDLGELDGNEIGPAETTLFMYGPDAERLFAGIESALRAYPLCQHAES